MLPMAPSVASMEKFLMDDAVIIWRLLRALEPAVVRSLQRNGMPNCPFLGGKGKMGARYRAASGVQHDEGVRENSLFCSGNFRCGLTVSNQSRRLTFVRNNQ